MSLLPIFEWLAQTPVGIAIRDAKWGFAIIEMVHLLALAMLGGTVLVLSLRLLGLGLRRQEVSRVARDLYPYFLGSLAVMLISGVLLLASEPLRCYYNPAFRWKMWTLLAAVIFSLGLNRRLAASGGVDLARPVAQLAGAVSLALWLGVGLAGRAIGLI